MRWFGRVSSFMAPAKLWVLGLLALSSLLAAGQTRTPSLEETLTWKDCGTTCGATAGSGAVAYGIEKLVTSPTLDGLAMEFWLDPQSPYGNFYWYTNLAKPASATTINGRYVEYRFSVYVPSQFDTAWRAVEWGVSVRNSGWWWRSAYQLSKSSGFRFYDPSLKTWISTGISLYNFSPGKWHSVRVQSQLVDTSSSRRVKHLFLEIDGVKKYLTNKSNPAVRDGSTYTSYKLSFQLDGQKLPTPYGVYYDKLTFRTWF